MIDVALFAMVRLQLALLILTSVGLNTLAQTLLKQGAGRGLLNVYLLGGIAAYGLSTLIYILVLSKMNLSVAYPVLIGLTVIATTISSMVLLHEKVVMVQWVGIGLLISGIAAIASVKIH